MANYNSNSKASRTALVGVLAAGSLALLWVACLSPSGRLGLDAVAGLFPVAAVMAAGRGAGYMCWAAAGILGLILLPDKGVALMYLLFFGVYPVLKSRFEGMQRQSVGWLLKLGYFNVVLAIFWFVLRALFLPNLPPWLNKSWMIWLLGNLVFVVYDIGLSRLIFGLFSRMAPGSRKRK